ncbi:hypothetical protein GJ496_007317 [Pomphorhynchus laevis]|nr:hypothetical protein GJ496_007317 [Pomphorhynchus laevis]
MDYPCFSQQDDRLASSLKAFPSFTVKSENAEFIKCPKSFYDTLMSRISTAKKRIVFSSLYIGTGEMERNIVVSIIRALDNEPNLSVTFILDYFRARRIDKQSSSNESSLTVLQPLLQAHGERVSIYLFLALRNRMLLSIADKLPCKLGEMLGVHHVKFYCIDDSTILSGANLSNSYFQNRLDRNLIIKDVPMFSNYIADVADKLGNMSFRVNSVANGLELCTTKPFTKVKLLDNSNEYQKPRWSQFNIGDCEKQGGDFMITPLMSVPCSIDYNNGYSKLMADFCTVFDRIWISSGYFNPTVSLQNALIQRKVIDIQVLHPSKQANGWFGASGLFRHVPSIYNCISACAYDFCRRFFNKCSSFAFKEYQKDDWTFHCKGFWGQWNGSKQLTMIIGSSNYGYRSTLRDSELDFVISSISERGNNLLLNERNLIFDNKHVVEVFHPAKMTLIRYVQCIGLKWLKRFL